MSELIALSQKYQAIAVVGTGKNTGKTVTVNYLLTGANRAGIIPGLTSTGRDGEKADILSALPKPAIHLPEKAMLATAAPCLRAGSARLEIVETTGLYNALGEIVLARVREAGTVEACGPERTGDLQTVIQRLRHFAQLVIADGAMDRVSASAPAVAEAVILATGAVVGSDLQKVVDLTVHAVRTLSTPAAAELTLPARQLLAVGQTGVQNAEGQIKVVPILTAINAPPQLADYLNEEYNCLLLGGALSDPLAELLRQASGKTPGLKVIVQDGTRIFVEPSRWQLLTRQVVVRAAWPVNLIAVTVNPVDPRGRRLPGKQLVDNLRALLPEMLVVDPMADGGMG